MTSQFTKHISVALLGIAILSSCSRPVAYYQHSPIVPYAVPATQTETTPVAEQTAETATELAEQANATVAQIEAYVRQDSKLVANKKLNNRMVRVKNLLASSAGTISPVSLPTTRKMNVAERLILKKMNRKIGQQLAPNHPEKALVKTGQLIGSLVLLIAGLVLLIAGSGTVAFIGLIVALVGAVGTIVSLLGIDS